MIVGNGSLAKLIQDRDGAIMFCSGISKQSFTDDDVFREIDLLTKAISDKCIFYFSSIGVFYKESEYYTHKLAMEAFVKLTFNNYNIVRIGNIWECTNPNTFLNYLRNNPEAVIYSEHKHMISAESLNRICQSLPLEGRNEICVFDEMLTVKECLKKK